jgi:3-oxoacyl-[acyl-carrier-protein] synthase-3
MSDPAAYVTGLGAFTPNDPVDNENIEDVLGCVNRISSRVKKTVLKRNGIKTRHYAIDPVTKEPTHSNTQLTAEAIRDLARRYAFAIDETECLACGTSSADQIIPHHASMVQAELNCPPCDVIATSGVCCSGMSAFKYGYMNVLTGQTRNAVVTGSELASPALRAGHFREEMERTEAEINRQPMLAFENDFLRWMLSDGAGAMLITDTPRDGGVNMRIDWMDLVSFANESDVCMFYGIGRNRNGSIESWRHETDFEKLCRGGFLNLGQDVKILQDRLPALMSIAIERMLKKRELRADDISWLLPHYSSDFFRAPLYDGLTDLEFEIPYERWFTNLETRGNTGAASIYIIIDELVSSGRAKPGDKLLCIVPESARMTFAFLHLTIM